MLLHKKGSIVNSINSKKLASNKQFLDAREKPSISRFYGSQPLILFCQIGLFVSILVCLSAFWFVCQHFGLLASILVCFLEVWFLSTMSRASYNLNFLPYLPCALGKKYFSYHGNLC